jgi:hypothetical protein
MHLKNGKSPGNGAYARKGITSRVMVATRSKVSLWLDGKISPGSYGWLFEDRFWDPTNFLSDGHQELFRRQ